MESIARNQATVAKIQQLEDGPLNPLTGKAWRKDHDKILECRRRLPVYDRFDEILNVYHQNQVFVLTSETGSGKSTQLPHVLLFDEYSSGLRVACTQPRRLAATSLAERVATEVGVVLGEEVGYQIGGEKKVDKGKKKSRLVYMTEGSLLGKLSSDKDLSEFACIIIDEAHERTVETDLLMAMLKQILLRRKDLKVVIMSATIEAKLFQDYFGNCPLVHISGRTFKVDVRYAKSGMAPSNFNLLAANTVAHIHKSHGPGNILVFLPGQGEITQVCDLIRKCTTGLDVLPLYGALSSGHQRGALGSTGPNRKCIVSTNVAEASLTIDNVVYVVDTGLSRQMVYNPRLGIEMLRVLPISQASARQRTGRAGRTSNGVCYRLYSKKDFDRMASSTEPAIRCKSVHSAVLQLVASGHVKIADFDWLSPPHPETIARAAQDLYDWGYLKDNGQATRSGRHAVRSMLEPIWFRALEMGAKHNCLMKMLDIVAVGSAQNSIFLRPFKYETAADVMHRTHAAFPSDHLTGANAFTFYMLAREKHLAEDGPKFNLEAWCKLHFLDYAALEEVRKSREKLGPFLKNVAKFDATISSTADKGVVLKALAEAFCTRAAIYHSTLDAYRTVHDNAPARLHPLSSLVNSNFEWIVYTKYTLSGGRVYLEGVSPVDAAWLANTPYFQDDRLPLKGTGTYRQEKVKKSLDDAKARDASEAN